MNEIIINEITPGLRETLVQNKWFSDIESNWKLGYGKGPDGVIGITEAISSFKEAMVHSGEEGFYSLGIYHLSEPVGFVNARDLGDTLKTVELFLFISPDNRGKGYGTIALDTILERIFKDKKIYRVQGSALSINKEAIKFFRSRGFTQEGIRKSAYWMGMNCFDVVPLRILRSSWERKENGDE